MSLQPAIRPWLPEDVTTGMLRRYQITHDTVYQYEAAVAWSRQQLHLAPRRLSRQQVLSHRLEVSPGPNQQWQQVDAFDNPVTLLEFYEPHERLAVNSRMDIEVSAEVELGSEAWLAWDKVAGQLQFQHQQAVDDSVLEAMRFRYASPFGRIKSEIAAYAADCFAPGRPMLEAVLALNHKIHRDIRFQPGSTTVTTPVLEVLRKRRGVCQDLAHLMIACLRSMGLAARYISGYILTIPPPGKTRLIGADASHAWVSVWCPGAARDSWIDLDPTNDSRPGNQHVTLAWGRDFLDVSPLRGMIHGGGEHQLRVAVTMQPLDELPLRQPLV